MKIMSYALSVMAGLCFVGSILILSGEGDIKHGTTRITNGLN